MEKITKDIIKQAKEIGSDDLEALFDLFFRVHICDDMWELETWTEGGVNIVLCLNTTNKVTDFNVRALHFNIDEEIDLHRQDDRYKAAFSISQSVDDFKEFRDWLHLVNDIIKAAVYGWDMPEVSQESGHIFLEDKLEAILNQIASDLAALQNNPDESWTDSIRDLNNPLGIFYDRICASVTDFENLKR